ncbi:response regulator transcription factor [Verrucomicrobiales bacterium]|jgi:DNA-binding NarL/FixJ family response regulator|nr:response regulator transcription factor [Verrucomicrobiales bacterium]MDB2347077.1 response regulator transcription factor [Verrucomicrobiales bacterium]MDC0503491.1 response regulator transcription factor [Verrucomicrobiales bacterium]MDF1786454.1 response regulator transcription factor [Verrucomicrobiales bacterium]NCF88925.1 response regulator [Verrucomicrobiaceae bacterium]
MKKRILIVDDHPVMRMGLQQLINSKANLEVCGEAGSAKEAMQQVAELKPDLVLLDMALPDGHGLEVLKDLAVMHDEVDTLVLSSNDESVYAERALKAGARGYIMKEAAATHLVTAIDTILDGQIYVSKQMSQLIVEMFTGKKRKGHTSSPIEKLTDREFEVFQLIGEGKGSREVAGQLGVSIRTIDAHRAHIKEKLALKDSNALVRQAVRWVETKQWD